MHRGDDPERIPSFEQITRELVAECVETAVGMVEPVMMPVTLRFRPASGPEAAAGLESARERDFAAAAEQFRAAVTKRPDDAALCFNLGLALEGAGDFAGARGAYQAAVGASAGKDVEAQKAAARAAALLECAAALGGRPARVGSPHRISREAALAAARYRRYRGSPIPT